MKTTEEILEYLREEIEFNKELSKHCYEHLAVSHDYEQLNLAKLYEGGKLALEDTIAYIRNLSHREKLIAIKKGTL